MISIKNFVLNPFRVNTYLLYDETKNAIIIDPGCYEDSERNRIVKFIEQEQLNIITVVNTHTHIDHIVGNNFFIDKYKTQYLIHKAGDNFLKNAEKWADMFDFKADKMYSPTGFIDEGDTVSFGTSVLKIIYTPGHFDGSICLICKTQKFVIVGDVLFAGSIGRTDFPTGNYELLKNNIINKLYTLGDEYIVYPGHGPSTTIGVERTSNPYVKA